MEIFGKLCLTVIIIVLSTLMSGYVLSNLYGWIITPIYGLKPITIPQAIGISLISHFLLLGVTLNMKSDQDKNTSFMTMLVAKLFTVIVIYGITLLTGYIVSLYI
jgi:FtsH-binding integral membrane protein